MIKSAIQQKTIGELLRSKRKERKLTLAQIAESIKIREEYLKALEVDDYQTFPSEVYLKGFLKNYAKYLGISHEQALALYRRDNFKKVEKPTRNIIDAIKNRTSNLVITPNRILVVLGVLLVLALILYLSTYIGKVLKKPNIVLSSPITISAEGEYVFETNEESINIIGELDSNAKVTLNGQEIGPASMTSFSKSMVLTSGLNKFVIKAMSPFGRESSIILNVTKGTTADTETNPTVTEINAVIDILIDNVNVTIFVDGSLKTDKIYTKGTQLSFIALDEIMLTSSKPSALAVTINGVREQIDTKSVSFELNAGEILKK